MSVYIRGFVDYPLSQYSTEDLLARLEKIKNIIKNSAHCDLDVELKKIVEQELEKREGDITYE
tara:strand:+ start:302 stop:490 length:189 start_codon:yes stop_codon:yes gene_type:complete